MLDIPRQYKKGIIGTIIFHIVLGIMFILFGYSIPLPLPEEEGILINFGNNDQGAGKVEPSSKKIIPEKRIKTPANTKNKENILTQDIEEVPVIKKKEEVKVKKKEIVKTKKEEITEKKEETKPVEEPRKVNPLTLYKGNKNNSESEGETTGNTNQGSETGSLDSKSHIGNNLGGDGPSFNLSGRYYLSLPKPKDTSQEEGKVVVEITVDKYGNVTNATPGVKGSTTLNTYLLKAAKDAALKAKFDRKPDAPAYQKGTITYHFVLQ